MLQNNIINEVALREHPNQVSLSQIRQQLSSKLHKCALIWSDKCAPCEIAFDELKKKLSPSTEPSEENLKELKHEIEESLATLTGFLIAPLKI